MYGLTHDMAGAPVVRVPRTVKVGIGRSAGPDIHTWIDANGQWAVGIGSGKKRQEKVSRFKTRAEAYSFYRAEQPKAQALPYPMKLAYFTFSRPGPDGTLVPDWDAIERHGPLPTELDIVFTDNAPLRAAYEMWSATGLQCRGDGINAERIVTLATAEEEKLAEQAAAEGHKFFPIVEGCFMRDCRYTHAPACKPHGRLAFQLINDIRLGAQAQFDTTSFRTISQLFSSLLVLRTFTGGGNPERGFLMGIPLRLLVRPWKTNHKGQPGKAYAVSLEFRSESIEGLRKKLLEYGAEFKRVMEPAKQLGAPVTEEGLPEDPDDAREAAAVTAEFYPEVEIEPGEEPTPEGSVGAEEDGVGSPTDDSQRAAASTRQATEALKGKLDRASHLHADALVLKRGDPHSDAGDFASPPASSDPGELF
jgi:hypothetical protein